MILSLLLQCWKSSYRRWIDCRIIFRDWRTYWRCWRSIYQFNNFINVRIFIYNDIIMSDNLLKKEKLYLVYIMRVKVHKIIFLTLFIDFSLLNSNFFKYLNVSYAAEDSKIVKIKHFVSRICSINSRSL